MWKKGVKKGGRKKNKRRYKRFFIPLTELSNNNLIVILLLLLLLLSLLLLLLLWLLSLRRRWWYLTKFLLFFWLQTILVRLNNTRSCCLCWLVKCVILFFDVKTKKTYLYIKIEKGIKYFLLNQLSEYLFFFFWLSVQPFFCFIQLLLAVSYTRAS